MPRAEAQTTIPVPLNALWAFMQAVDNWAPLFLGYRSHEGVSDREYRWEVTGRVGLMSRTLSMRVLVTEWQPPERVAFQLQGLNERVVGSGALTAGVGAAGAVTAGGTDAGSELRFALEMKLEGPLGPMVNAQLGPVLKQMTTHLVTRIRDRLMQAM